MKQILTSNGMNLILRGLAGSTIEFTKIKFGNGEEQGVTAVDLNNPIMEVPISSITRDSNFITLGADYKNADVPTEFSALEIGVFAKDPDDETKEILYCLWYEEDPVKADYISPVEDRMLGTKLEILVFVDTVENITADMSKSTEAATKAELTQHTNDTNNPHKVTKEQVGLGNVPNVSSENQSPRFTKELYPITVHTKKDAATGEIIKTTSFENIEPGETLGAIIRKIRTAISALLSHLSSRNPHYITAKLIGAASANHYHNASSINSGTLGIKRGGTGGDTAAEAKLNLGIRAGQCTVQIEAGNPVSISYQFPTAFPDNAVTYVVATPMIPTPRGLEIGIQGMSHLGFQAIIYSETYSGTVNFNWIACQ